jgi:ribose transport system ATP-binding protein
MNRQIQEVGQVMPAAIELRGISKSFPGVNALVDVDFEAAPGEVHVLIGENGAGKSTLGNIMLGVHMPNAGEILVRGEKVEFRGGPKDALQFGIGGVHQELMLVPWLSAAQNIFLNREPRRGLGGALVDTHKANAAAAEILSSLGADFDVTRPVKKLTTAEKQMVEISKILLANPKIIILDEPTAILSEEEVERLFEKIRRMREEGATIIYVSHRLPEIRRIGDRVTVLRDGEKVATVRIADTTDDELVQMMVGREITSLYPRNRRKPGEEVLRLEDCSVVNGPKNVNLTVREGEIVGLAGLVGAGRTEIARAVFGIDAFESGRVLLYGKEQPLQNQPSRMIENEVGLIPEDRKELGLALNQSVVFNITLATLRRMFRFIFRKRRAEEVATEMVDEVQIKTPSVGQRVIHLSGGNQQKVVIAKWLLSESKLFMFDEPTKGIDVGAKFEIHKMMDRLVNDGAGVLMISSDLPEVLGMSDRVYVMFRGRIVGEISHEQADQESVAALMLGTTIGESK